VQLFREIVPAPKAVGVLINVPDPFRVPLLHEIETAGLAEKIDIVPAMVNAPAELGGAYDMLLRRRVDGVLVQPSLGMTEPAALALKHRLPSISYRREFADAGGLLSYGANQMENDRNVASYVDRILKGARAADLPALQSSRFELVVNQRTAKAIGLVFSPMFLARADEVIE
jgi:putative ABC transport system substrate-binding protein